MSILIALSTCDKFADSLRSSVAVDGSADTYVIKFTNRRCIYINESEFSFSLDNINYQKIISVDDLLENFIFGIIDLSDKDYHLMLLQFALVLNKRYSIAYFKGSVYNYVTMNSKNSIFISELISKLDGYGATNEYRKLLAKHPLI